ncbi:MAG: winged helix-turn-helix domain-containing protein [Methanobacteriaceae archaeon]
MVKNNELNQNMILEQKLDNIHNDLKKMIELNNEEHMQILLNMIKTDYLSSIYDFINETTELSLEKRIASDCDMKDNCKPIFKDYVLSEVKNNKPEEISDDIIGCGKSNIKAISTELNQTYNQEHCDECFLEVSEIFENNMNLISSLNLYNKTHLKNYKIGFDEEEVAKNFLEPIANTKRLQILKALASEPQSFSNLSKKTSLRGGGLLFHLDKLIDKNIIMQKNGHGDYLITKKGLKLLLILSNDLV